MKLKKQMNTLKNTKPVRLVLSRKRGFNLQAVSLALNGLPAVNVARPGNWGNPFIVGRNGTAEECAVRYTRNLQLRELRGKNLACWCAVYLCDRCGVSIPHLEFGEQRCHNYYAQGQSREVRRCPGTLRRQPCHADVLLELANV
jgi:hypothetical protein